MRQPSTPIRRVTPTVSLTAYNDGDVIGGIQEIPDVLGHTKTGLLKTLVVKDAEAQGPDLTILLFDQLPTGTYTDNEAFAWGSGDFAKCIGHISVAASGFITVGADKIYTNDQLSINVQNNKPQDSGPALPGLNQRSLWAIIVSEGTPDYAAADDLSLIFGFVVDG